MRQIKSFFKSNFLNHISWKGVFVLTFISGFIYVFMEWLFTVTKPSFMSNLNIFGKLEILDFVGSLSALIGLIPILFFFLLSRPKILKKLEQLIFNLAVLIPTAFFSALILILVDNFTYTIFRFGIVSTNGIWRAFYALMFIVLFIVMYRYTHTTIYRMQTRIQKSKFGWVVAIFVMIFMLTSVIIPYFRHGTLQSLIPELNLKPTNEQYPNIILVTSDGLNAGHMSLYGYKRDTTPFLRQLSENSLVAENAFTNSANTSGSIVSILNSKFTTTTRVLYPPNILRAQDSYQHLPGILKSLGYYTSQMGFEVYVDSYNLNLLSGFDEVNGRSFLGSNYFDRIKTFLPGESAYFFYETFNRIFDRLRHIFFIHKMENAFEQVTMVSESFSDIEKLEKLFTLLETKDQPIFVHIHWMGTHGAKFFAPEQIFSSGKQKELQNDWDFDFYDDSIYEIDQILNQINDKLIIEGKAENSIIVFGSDHAQKYLTHVRIPIFFHFPNGDHAGRILMNAQNIDIAPTLLDYIGYSIPEWMEGDSLLRGLESQRLIFSAGVGKATVEEGFTVIDRAALKPPFYQFGFFSIINCDRWYRLSVVDGISFQQGKIGFYDTECTNEPLTDLEVLQLFVEHLKEKSFDTGILEEWIEEYTKQ